MADLPDLSHLTAEERAIIENVMMRQKEEEERENEIMRKKQDEVAVLEDTIRQRSEQQKKAGIELDATCHICLKTKFADGVGHVCHYCTIRCCARCGGKVTLRSSKVIWVCILCRKKQELLSKTGQWINKGPGQDAIMRRIEADMQHQVNSPSGGAPLFHHQQTLVQPGHQQQHQQLLQQQSCDKRPKLERARSAAEPEMLNSPSSPLRRQYSQQEQRLIPPDEVDDPNYYRGELEGLMRTHPHLVHPRQRFGLTPQSQQQSGVPTGGISLPETPKKHRRSRPETPTMQQQHQLQQPQISFSSSEEDLRSTPECDERLREKETLLQHSSRLHDDYRVLGIEDDEEAARLLSQRTRAEAAAAAAAAASAAARLPRTDHDRQPCGRRRRDADRDADADARKFTERRKKTVRFDGHYDYGGGGNWETGGSCGAGSCGGPPMRWDSDRQGSQDSATKDSGIDTSSTFTSSEDSNRGDGPKHGKLYWYGFGTYNRPMKIYQNSLSWQVSADGTRMVGHMILRKNITLDQSSGGLNPSFNAAILGLKVVGGRLLENGSRGAIIEKVKKGSIADIDGQLRPGDEVIEWNGRLLRNKSAEEVYDIIAESKQEPQVELIVSRPINRRAAQASWRHAHSSPIPPHKDLYSSIESSGRSDKPSVLVTSPGSPDLHAHGSRSSRGHQAGGRPDIGQPNVGGRLQVKLGFDPAALQLIITVVCCAGLTPRQGGQPRNPYAKIFLLPDRSEKSKRRTKTLANTNEPRWAQTFVYSGIRRADLKHRIFEVTVWDYVRYGANDFLGEVLLDLSVCPLDDEPEWYYLAAHEDVMPPHSYRREYDPIVVPPPGSHHDLDMILTPTDHLSPPSTTTSRLSDSDTTSECDLLLLDLAASDTAGGSGSTVTGAPIISGGGGRRFVADGASVSSVGSSSSPPPEHTFHPMDVSERRSRRDMSPQGRKRAAGMMGREKCDSGSYSQQGYRKNGPIASGQRSHSAAPTDSPSENHHRSESRHHASSNHYGSGRDHHSASSSRHHSRARSKSPAGHRSLSPPEVRLSSDGGYEDRGYYYTRDDRGYISGGGGTGGHSGISHRFQSRSATATPTGSPKKRQLPQIPQTLHRAIRDRMMTQDLDDKARSMKHRLRQLQTYRSTGSGWDRHYAGLSDSDLATHSYEHGRSRPRHLLSPDKDYPGDSDLESVVSVTSSALSTQSERPRGSRGLSADYEHSGLVRVEVGIRTPRDRESLDPMLDRDVPPSRRGSKRGQFTRSLSNTDVPPDDKTDGSLSDTAAHLTPTPQSLEEPSRGTSKTDDSRSPTKSGDSSGGSTRAERTRSDFPGATGMGKKSNSTSQLSATGRKRRMGFGKRGKNSFTVHRSEEVIPGDALMRLHPNTGSSRASSQSSDGEGSNDGDRWSPSFRMAAESNQLADFIGGLGPGQLVGRQVLGSPIYGDIQLSLCFQKGCLEVEVIRARDLLNISHTAILPLPFVKVFIVNGKRVLDKGKTGHARRTLDPLFQQHLTFRKGLQGSIMQVTVWGDHSRNRRDFMGVAQILLDDLNLSNIVIGWYRLFGTSSLYHFVE